MRHKPCQHQRADADTTISLRTKVGFFFAEDGYVISPKTYDYNNDELASFLVSKEVMAFTRAYLRIRNAEIRASISHLVDTISARPLKTA